MYLRTLEIQGFKSFPDKTVLQFGDAITAIVGPNGSGKSNISDAISWVLGEQSSKALRGTKMEDVIFGGTLKRAQVGFAEASLLLDNSDGALRIETGEVMVTRRYYRSGESEYYINRQSARLRDINELFMDTGLGREGYSNISQGKIDEILSLKSIDRREVFEEAAGISKYRHRKEETERRLESTEDNLAHIGGKILELELQLEPLRDQADRARKYLSFREELKSLEVSVWLESLDKLAAAAKKNDEDYNAAAVLLSQAHEGLDALYATAEQLGAALRRHDAEIDAIRTEIAAQEQTIHERESESAVLRADRKNNQDNEARIASELKEQQDRRGGIEAQLAQLEAKIAELTERREAAERRLAEVQEQSAELNRDAEGSARALAAVAAEQSAAAAERSRKQLELSSLDRSLEEQQGRREALLRRGEEAKASLEQALASQSESAERLKEAREQAEAAKNAIAGYQLRLQARAQKRDGLQQGLDAVEVELNTTDHRRKLYHEMEREYEGYSKAVKTVMQEAARGVLKNIHGPVSKLLKTEDRCTVAVETALGAAMQYIVVSSEEDGKAAIDLLKRRDAGRATFLPLHTIQGRRLQERGVEDAPGFVGIAADLVDYDVRYDAIFQNLLGRTVVAENMDWAIAMARRFSSRFRIVTLDGQVLNAGGSMTGGSTIRSAGVLSRANELARLERQVKTLQERREALRRELAESSHSAAEVESQIETARGRLRQAEDEVLRLESAEQQRQLLLDAARKQEADCRAELAREDELSAGAAERKETLRREIAQLETHVRSLEETVSARTRDRTDQDERLAGLTERLTEIRLDAAACDAERVATQDSVEQLRELELAMRSDRAASEALLERCKREGEALDGRIETLVQETETLNRTLTQTKARLQDALRERAGTEAQKTKTEKEAQEQNKDLLSMERKSAWLEQKKNQTALEEKLLLDKLWDGYELTPTTARPLRQAALDTAEANRQIAALKRKLSALGTPNLGAIEEFDRINERYEYLSSQRDDVRSAKWELVKIIESITKEMTEIFVREFQRINEYFGQTFEEMFGGGKGTLVLEEPEDPLGCGIEICVQPPGKQVKTITLLSGGEKAFVAIALYFAILRVRPTPFCLLDEIDAALDDSNVRRFAAYLRNLCDKTQFIVITHRRGTMEEADVLYGVTMQEQGVSKMLHIDLDQMEDQLGLKAN